MTTEPKQLAQVSYTVLDNSSDILIDIELDDYNDLCIDAMCNILKTLSKESSIVHTINMIRDAMIADGEEEALLILLTKIGEEIIAKQQNDKIKDEEKPCISPSDML
mgnify:CR=1 FL=1